jgi:alpha,alpha-trehalose phosphorylase
MYALKKYVEVSGDTAFLENEGAEMLVETARLWADLGFFSPSKGGKFCINSVTGPDEYNAVVNNNLYTNLMARENLRYAAQTVAWLREKRPRRYAALVHDTRLDDGEIAAWQRAADQMHVPYDEAKGIHLQDDDSLNLQPWDFEDTPPEKYPLLLHFHPLVIYRHQVIKQADVVLAMFLLGNHFSHEQKRRNFEFYDPLTTGDSSLSVSIQSIIAWELGLTEEARNYARYAVLMDLADIGANVEHGCHIASMGGTWMALINGVGGMRDYDGQISFNPALDARLKTLQFSLLIRGRRLRVEIDQETQTATYLFANGPDLEIAHCGNRVTLSEGKPTRLKIRSSLQRRRRQHGRRPLRSS